MKKSKVHKVLTAYLNEKIGELQKSLQSLQESRDSETKSSVGDKYETGRAMIQNEMEQLGAQLTKLNDQKMVLQRIHPERKKNTVELGSLVTTTQGVYFLSIAVGEIEVDGNKVLAISPAAPVGKGLDGAKKGETINFQSWQIEILDIL